MHTVRSCGDIATPSEVISLRTLDDRLRENMRYQRILIEALNSLKTRYRYYCALILSINRSCPTPHIWTDTTNPTSFLTSRSPPDCSIGIRYNGGLIKSSESLSSEAIEEIIRRKSPGYHKIRQLPYGIGCTMNLSLICNSLETRSKSPNSRVCSCHGHSYIPNESVDSLIIGHPVNEMSMSPTTHAGRRTLDPFYDMGAYVVVDLSNFSLSTKPKVSRKIKYMESSLLRDTISSSTPFRQSFSMLPVFSKIYQEQRRESLGWDFGMDMVFSSMIAGIGLWTHQNAISTTNLTTSGSDDSLVLSWEEWDIISKIVWNYCENWRQFPFTYYHGLWEEAKSRNPVTSKNSSMMERTCHLRLFLDHILSSPSSLKQTSKMSEITSVCCIHRWEAVLRHHWRHRWLKSNYEAKEIADCSAGISSPSLWFFLWIMMERLWTDFHIYEGTEYQLWKSYITISYGGMKSQGGTSYWKEWTPQQDDELFLCIRRSHYHVGQSWWEAAATYFSGYHVDQDTSHISSCFLSSLTDDSLRRAFSFCNINQNLSAYPYTPFFLASRFQHFLNPLHAPEHIINSHSFTQSRILNFFSEEDDLYFKSKKIITLGMVWNRDILFCIESFESKYLTFLREYMKEKNVHGDQHETDFPTNNISISALISNLASVLPYFNGNSCLENVKTFSQLVLFSTKNFNLESRALTDSLNEEENIFSRCCESLGSDISSVYMSSNTIIWNSKKWMYEMMLCIVIDFFFHNPTLYSLFSEDEQILHLPCDLAPFPIPRTKSFVASYLRTKFSSISQGEMKKHESKPLVSLELSKKNNSFDGMEIRNFLDVLIYILVIQGLSGYKVKFLDDEIKGVHYSTIEKYMVFGRLSGDYVRTSRLVDRITISDCFSKFSKGNVRKKKRGEF